MHNGLFPLILIGGLIAFVLFTPLVVEAEVLGLWSINENTVVLDDSNNTVNIGENETTKDKLNIEGNLNVEGTINSTGGNSTTWNEAYFWGDHSLAGYLFDWTDGDPFHNLSASSDITSAMMENWNDSIDADDWLQNGFVNRSNSSISFTDGNRTFRIDPVSGYFYYYIEGINYTVDESATVVIDDTEGIWYIYYDDSTLTALHSPTHEQLENLYLNKATVGILYWDSDNSKGQLLEERHGLSMSPYTHLYLHETVGTRYSFGLALNNILVDEDGDTDTHAQFGTATGQIFDEDIEHDINFVASTTGLQIWYRDTTLWTFTTNAGFSMLTTGSGRLAWDDNGTLTEVTNNDYVLCHVFVGSFFHGNPVVAIGQSEYATKKLAQEGAVTEINNIVSIADVSPELKPIATVIFQTSNSYGNSVKARVVSTDEGDNYVDWTASDLSPGRAASDHGNLVGLGDDDHTQYALIDGSRNFTGDVIGEENLTINGLITGDILNLTGIDIWFNTDEAFRDVVLSATPGLGTIRIALPQASGTMVAKEASNSWSGTQFFANLKNYLSYQWVHTGDTNTYTEYTTDRMAFFTGGLRVLTLKESTTNSVTVNEQVVDIDFIVHGNSVQNLIFVNASGDNVGINTDTPNDLYILDVEGDIECTSLDETSDERVKNLISVLPKNKVIEFCENISIWLFTWNDYSYIYEDYEECQYEENYNDSSGEWENGTVCYTLQRRISIDYGDNTNNYDVGIPAQSLYEYIRDSFGLDYAKAIVTIPDNENVELWNVNYKSVSLIFNRYTQILNERINNIEEFLEGYGYIGGT